MTTPMVGRWREPIFPGVYTKREQIMWARCRPPADRTSRPRTFQIVGLRLQQGGPVVRARIVSVADQAPEHTRPTDELDENVWRYQLDKNSPRRAPIEIDEHGLRAVELVEDPWFDCVVETLEGPKLRTMTREARLPGSSGWLPWKD